MFKFFVRSYEKTRMNFLANLISECLKKKKRSLVPGAGLLLLESLLFHISGQKILHVLLKLFHSIFICKMRIIIILTSYVIM